MPDYIYLLENRLSSEQQNALRHVRDTAREAGMTVFLTGGAVRDLTSGSPVRDLDFTVQGHASKLKKALEKTGATVWGEHEPTRTLYLCYPNSIRVEVSGARREEYPKPGKPVYHAASILEDLRRRDFTANAMALSLNEGSYGLLMDPMNGVADIEARQLRLVSNYGFLEEPSRMIRALRFSARLGWELEEKTKTRYANAKEEGVISALSGFLRGYELEEIAHEEDGLKILRALEAEGWMHHLFPAWTSAKVDSAALDELHGVLTQLQVQGVTPDPSTAQMELLTGKMAAKDLAALKAAISRQGFVHEWNNLDADAREFAKLLTGKQEPSATWKLFSSHKPQAVLWLGFTSKSAPVQAKFNDFFNVWPEARQKIPYALMGEMRITPELPGYQDLLRQIFFGVIDGRLTTDEQMRAFLEPYSPPAPPPPVSVRRSRGKKAGPKIKEAEEEEEEELEGLPNPEELEADESESEDEADEDGEDEDEERPARPVKAVAAKSAAKGAPSTAVSKSTPATAAGKPAANAAANGKAAVPAKAAKAHEAKPHEAARQHGPGKPHEAAKAHEAGKSHEPAKAAAKTAAKPALKSDGKHDGKHEAKKPAPAVKAAAKPAEKKAVAPAKHVSAKHVPAKHVPAKHVPAKHVPAKAAAKPAPKGHAKPTAKAPAKQVKKAVPAKKKH